MGQNVQNRSPKLAEVFRGKGLSDENIMQQMITFLVAGHETTSGITRLPPLCAHLLMHPAGFLSFFMYFAIANPDVYAKLRAEIDSVVGAERMRPEHLARLPYMVAAMRETLRLRRLTTRSAREPSRAPASPSHGSPHRPHHRQRRARARYRLEARTISPRRKNLRLPW